jgi:hypothetical protein
MRRGPYLHPPGFTGGALRMASEDSRSLDTLGISPRHIVVSAFRRQRLTSRTDASSRTQA